MEDRFFALRGPDTGKPSLLMQRARVLLEGSGAGEGMLILARDMGRQAEWERELRHVYRIEPCICTFMGFVRQELETFYPLTSRKTGITGSATVRPVFMDRDSAVNLVSRVVQYRREKEGSFPELSATSEKIASDMLESLETAAMAGIPGDEAFDRLYASLEIKNEVRRKIYKDAGDISAAFRGKCLELGTLDRSAAIELYCGCLLEDAAYTERLRRRFNYLLAEDVQEWDGAPIVLAELLLPGLKSLVLGYDPEAPLGASNRLRRNKLIEGRLIARCSIVAINERPAEAGELSEALFEAILTGRINRKGRVAGGTAIERHPAAELRSEMLEQLGERVCEMIDAEGCKPSDITILSTHADIVTELVLADVLGKRGHGLTNTASGTRASESRLCRALLALAGICHPRFGIYPSRDNVRLLSETLFALDPARASMLAAKACNSVPHTAFPESGWPGLADIFDEEGLKKYLFVTAWISGYEGAPEEEMGVFLQRALLELFLEGERDETELERAKKLIDRAADFCRTVSRFGRNAGRDFAVSAGSRMDVRAGGYPGSARDSGEAVALATPAVYLKSGLISRVTVICGLSSRYWSSARSRELVNPNVLSAAWEADRIYTTAGGEADRTLYLADVMRAVVRSCGEKLVIFESLLNANGYENSGILPEIFDELEAFNNMVLLQ